MVKSMSLLNKSGYVHIDFAFAITFFFIFFYTVYTIHMQGLYAIKDSKNQVLYLSQARDICYILNSYEGKPSNWQLSPASMQVLGLKNETSGLISMAKVSKLDNSIYFQILDGYDLEDHVYIEVKDLVSNVVYSSVGTKSSKSQFAEYHCYGTSPTSVVDIGVRVWS